MLGRRSHTHQYLNISLQKPRIFCWNACKSMAMITLLNLFINDGYGCMILDAIKWAWTCSIFWLTLGALRKDRHVQSTKKIKCKIVVYFVHTSANVAAHLCAKSASVDRHSYAWVNMIPRFLLSCLQHDRNFAINQWMEPIAKKKKLYMLTLQLYRISGYW